MPWKTGPARPAAQPLAEKSTCWLVAGSRSAGGRPLDCALAISRCDGLAGLWAGCGDACAPLWPLRPVHCARAASGTSLREPAALCMLAGPGAAAAVEVQSCESCIGSTGPSGRRAIGEHCVQSSMLTMLCKQLALRQHRRPGRLSYRRPQPKNSSQLPFRPFGRPCSRYGRASSQISRQQASTCRTWHSTPQSAPWAAAAAGQQCQAG